MKARSSSVSIVRRTRGRRSGPRRVGRREAISSVVPADVGRHVFTIVFARRSSARIDEGMHSNDLDRGAHGKIALAAVIRAETLRGPDGPPRTIDVNRRVVTGRAHHQRRTRVAHGSNKSIEHIVARSPHRRHVEPRGLGHERIVLGLGRGRENDGADLARDQATQAQRDERDAVDQRERLAGQSPRSHPRLQHDDGGSAHDITWGLKGDTPLFAAASAGPITRPLPVEVDRLFEVRHPEIGAKAGQARARARDRARDRRASAESRLRTQSSGKCPRRIAD